MSEPPPDNFPPSGRLLSLYGLTLNNQPADLLLQVIEWQFASNDARWPDFEENLRRALVDRISSRIKDIMMSVHS
jgi:hypothetical protein